MRRSLQTFMNAMTGADYTFYPFATQNAQDFRNLLSVYVDATFFPRLRPLDFHQEGHRLEWVPAETDAAAPAPAPTPAALAGDEFAGQQLAYKGVVFNEMKGALSDAASLFSYALRGAIYPAPLTYHYNSGGHPGTMVGLTHQQLVDFHRQHYHPGNAKFFTYGDLPPTLAMAHVNQHVLQRFPAPPPPAAPLPSTFAATRPSHAGTASEPAAVSPPPLSPY